MIRQLKGALGATSSAPAVALSVAKPAPRASASRQPLSGRGNVVLSAAHASSTGCTIRQLIGDLYRCRWQVELIFKWIKQHLRIKAFFGISESVIKRSGNHRQQCKRFVRLTQAFSRTQ
jgi:hypothetical protein